MLTARQTVCMLERSKTKTEEHEENEMNEWVDELLEDLEALRPRVPSGAIIRFNRNVMAATYTYLAIFAGGVWYVTGSLKGRRTFDHDELVAILAEDETTNVMVPESWAPVTWTD